MPKRRLTVFQNEDILQRLRRKEKQRDIQLALRVSSKSVVEVRHVAHANGWLAADAAAPNAAELDRVLAEYKAEQRKVGLQASSVEQHRSLVEEWVRKRVETKTIWSALKRDHGYTGHYSSVRRFVAKLKRATPDPVVPLYFGPGEVAQVDFGSGPRLCDATGKERKTWVFVMTLAYSRHQYAELVWDQSERTWLRCHSNAFQFFGGVVGKVVIDNLKAGIVKACRYDHQVQRSYGEFARQFGFIIAPCIVRTPEHKGRVESGVHYVKRSFLNSPRQFRSLEDANRQLMEWILSEAGNRVHGTTHQMPLALFAEEEKAALKPLPAERVEIAVWSTVKLHPDCHVTFGKAYYSAPYRYIGKELDLRAGDSTVALFDRTECVAFHPRATRPGQRMTCRDHFPPEKLAYLQQTPQWCFDEARKVGEACYDFMCALLEDGVTDRLRAAQGVLRLRKKFGGKRLEAACRRAIAFDNIHYRTVKRILEQGHDLLPLDEGEGGQIDLPFVDAPRFARDIETLFCGN